MSDAQSKETSYERLISSFSNYEKLRNKYSIETLHVMMGDDYEEVVANLEDAADDFLFDMINIAIDGNEAAADAVATMLDDLRVKERVGDELFVKRDLMKAIDIIADARMQASCISREHMAPESDEQSLE